MNKSKQKKEYASYNPAIIKKLKEKYGVTTQFINASLRGDRTSYCSLNICADYKLIERAVTKAINKL
jgi:hypothetical protein